MTSPVYVLSMDGGGVRGLYQAEIIRMLQKSIGPFQNKFDLICGTSIGGLTALLLGKDEKLKNPSKYYTEEVLKSIFNESLFDKIVGSVQFDPIYNGVGKAKMIDKYLPDSLMSEQKIKTAVISYKMGKAHPAIISSWDSKTSIPGCSKWTLREAAAATSSAPVYFPSVCVGGDDYLDGGIGANNPSILAIAMAKEQFPGRPIKLLSIGTGTWAPKYGGNSTETWGGVQWITKGSLIDLMMSATSSHNTLACKMILENDGEFLRINNNNITDIGLDDIDKKSRDKLRSAALATLKKDTKAIYKFFGISE